MLSPSTLPSSTRLDNGLVFSSILQVWPIGETDGVRKWMGEIELDGANAVSSSYVKLRCSRCKPEWKESLKTRGNNVHIDPGKRRFIEMEFPECSLGELSLTLVVNGEQRTLLQLKPMTEEQVLWKNIAAHRESMAVKSALEWDEETEEEEDETMEDEEETEEEDEETQEETEEEESMLTAIHVPSTPINRTPGDSPRVRPLWDENVHSLRLESATVARSVLLSMESFTAFPSASTSIGRGTWTGVPPPCLRSLPFSSTDNEPLAPELRNLLEPLSVSAVDSLVHPIVASILVEMGAKSSYDLHRSIFREVLDADPNSTPFMDTVINRLAAQHCPMPKAGRIKEESSASSESGDSVEAPVGSADTVTLQ